MVLPGWIAMTLHAHWLEPQSLILPKEGLKLPQPWILAWKNKILLVLQLFTQGLDLNFLISAERGVWYFVNQWALSCWIKLGNKVLPHHTVVGSQSLIMLWECWHLTVKELWSQPRPTSRVPLQESNMQPIQSVVCCHRMRRVTEGLLLHSHWCCSRRLVCLLLESAPLLDP